MPMLWMLLAMFVLILLRSAVGFRERRRRRELQALDPDGQWWDGRADVWRYDRHHWGWGFRP